MQKILIASAAIMASSVYAQDEDEETPRTYNISPETQAIEAASDVCEKDMEKYLAELSDRDKMQMGLKAMRVVKDALTMAKESSFTADEKAHRMRHCDQKKMSKKEKKLCRYMAGSLIKEGKINYMTLKGRAALDDVCEVQHDISSCRASCKLQKEFWKKPTASDCDLVFPKWQAECKQRAAGEISHDGNTHEEIEQGAEHRKVIGVCRKTYNDEISKCQDEYNKLMKLILKKKGNIARNDSKQVGSCFYNQLKNFGTCVADAPEAPEGLEFKRNKPQSGNEMARDFLKSLMDVAKTLKKDKTLPSGRQSRRGGRGRANDWSDRNNTRRRRRVRVQRPTKPVSPDEDEDEVERNEPVEANEERLRIFEFGDE